MSSRTGECSAGRRLAETRTAHQPPREARRSRGAGRAARCGRRAGAALLSAPASETVTCRGGGDPRGRAWEGRRARGSGSPEARREAGACAARGGVRAGAGTAAGGEGRGGAWERAGRRRGRGGAEPRRARPSEEEGQSSHWARSGRPLRAWGERGPRRGGATPSPALLPAPGEGTVWRRRGQRGRRRRPCPGMVVWGNAEGERPPGQRRGWGRGGTGLASPGGGPSAGGLRRGGGGAPARPPRPLVSRPGRPAAPGARPLPGYVTRDLPFPLRHGAAGPPPALGRPLRRRADDSRPRPCPPRPAGGRLAGLARTAPFIRARGLPAGATRWMLRPSSRRGVFPVTSHPPPPTLPRVGSRHRCRTIRRQFLLTYFFLVTYLLP